MTIRRISLLATVCLAPLVFPLWVRHSAESRLQALREVSGQEAGLAAQLAADNRRISSTLAQSERSLLPAGDELTKLLKLRNECRTLRSDVQQVEPLRSKVQRLRTLLHEAEQAKEAGPDNYTALLADEMPKRQARVAQLRRWLDGMPGESIPELKFLSDADWIKRVDDPLVTDDDYRSAMSFIRADAERKFAQRAYPALTQYMQANGGQFPTDMTQLAPYFASPMDPAILQRYGIVPASSMVSFLAGLGGDWVITENFPINKDVDQRMAIGSNGGRQTIQRGRWDPLQQTQ